MVFITSLTARLFRNFERWLNWLEFQYLRVLKVPHSLGNHKKILLLLSLVSLVKPDQQF
jgi:hypothetical protein